MAFEPQIDLDRLQPLIDALESARQDILALDVPPMLERWLRRLTEARGAHMSTRIEGNPMTEEQVREVFARAERGTDAAELENLNYRDAVRFAYQYADDPSADIDGGFIRALHFNIVREVDPYGSAGRYRSEQNVVRSGGRTIYMPPPPDQVSRLMDDLVEWLRASRGPVHPLVLAAVAHIEFINIHPFDDGNGRTARALTAYFLARGGWRLRGFVSVEQVFGEDVEAYYSQLQRLGERYPGQESSLTDWISWTLERFVVAAEQQVGDANLEAFDRAVTSDIFESMEGLPARAALALTYVSLFERPTKSQYVVEASVSSATAVADLNALVRARYLVREGAGRSTHYAAGERFPYPAGD